MHYMASPLQTILSTYRKASLGHIKRQSVSTDKDSGIVNDANLYATETMNNAKYPLELLLRVATVSIETNKIVAGIPKFAI
jgi:predicted helicase